VISGRIKCFLGVPEVHMSEFVYTSEQEIVILRHVGIQEFTWFTPFLPFFTRNHHSRSLAGKYTFIGGSAGYWVKEIRISDFR